MKPSLRIFNLCLGMVTSGAAQTVHSVGNIFKPQATPAESVYHLSVLVMMVCAAIFITVAGLLTFTIVRFRGKAGDGREPAQVYGSDRIEIAWTVIPILIVLVLTMATARVVIAIQNKPCAPGRYASNRHRASVVVGDSICGPWNRHGKRAACAGEHSGQTGLNVPKARVSRCGA